MKAAEFIAIVERVQYKPGWTVEARARDFSDGPSAVAFGIKFYARDVHNPPERIQVGKGEMLSPWDLQRFRDARAVVQWVYSQILELEMHELDEWFAFDGVQVHPAHPGEAMPMRRPNLRGGDDRREAARGDADEPQRKGRTPLSAHVPLSAAAPPADGGFVRVVEPGETVKWTLPYDPTWWGPCG